MTAETADPTTEPTAEPTAGTTAEPSAETARNTETVRRYLRVFETRNVAELAELVAEDVLVHGAGIHGRGRHLPEGAVLTPGLSNCRVRVDDLAAAGDRVTVAFTLTYTHDRTGRDLTMTGLKSYRLAGGRIVEFWGETDLYGLLRQAGLVPERIPPF
ncbi:nuclear transport factor 2 family protein [Kitasatospora sp. NPDC088134]|uniref:nuclear transport factor 2 family protein n=1 Tax=Kitasatospora sp. NPDC088134 TaxID=3364071 RepID=UPI0038129F46